MKKKILHFVNAVVYYIVVCATVCYAALGYAFLDDAIDE